MPELIESSNQPNPDKGRFTENNRIFEVLDRFEFGYHKRHLIVGGTGVAGAVGHETRAIYDFDTIVARGDLPEATGLLQNMGFLPLSPEETAARIIGNEGAVLRRPMDGLIADVAVGDFRPDGLVNPIGVGFVFIPQLGLDHEAKLRGIHFMTFTPEVHYFFKNRATRRVPWQTIFLQNRAKDEEDLIELTKVIDPVKANKLIELGLKYTGQHPLPARVIAELRSRFSKHRQNE